MMTFDLLRQDVQRGGVGASIAEPCLTSAGSYDSDSMGHVSDCEDDEPYDAPKKQHAASFNPDIHAKSPFAATVSCDEIGQLQS